MTHSKIAGMRAVLDMEYGTESVNFSVSMRSKLLEKVVSSLDLETLEDYHGRRATILQYLIHQGCTRMKEQEAKLSGQYALHTLDQLETEQ